MRSSSPSPTRPVSELDPPVRAALRVGAYQLVHGVAAHAAVGETVDAASRATRPRASSTRCSAASRLGPPWPEPAELAVALLVPRLDRRRARARARRDDATREVLARDGNQPAAVTLRPNPPRVNAGARSTRAPAAGAASSAARLVPDALVVRGTGDPRRLPAVAEGRATPQDQGSQAVVAVPRRRAGDRVLDVAAAPGGKATAVAERVGATGWWSRPTSTPDGSRLVAEAARASASANVVARRRRRPPPARSTRRTFDRVLVDAPCSGLGVLRRRPEARWRIQPEAVERARRAPAHAARAAAARAPRRACSSTRCAR